MHPTVYINKKKHNKTKKSIRNEEPIKEIIKDDVVSGGTGGGDESFLPLSTVGWIKSESYISNIWPVASCNSLL